MSYNYYLKGVEQLLVNWAEQHHKGELDPKYGVPVLLKQFTSGSILAPPDKAKSDQIFKLIPRHKLDNRYNSLKSSQALCQSVFGGILIFGRLELLNGLQAECGRPAFFDDYHDYSLEMEYEVDFLGEKPNGRTSIDVMFLGKQNRVAVECKFTEKEFGTCSRPKLKKDCWGYKEQKCNRNYQIQRGRNERCSLTQIGIRYWDFLPKLFNWDADRDYTPCPFEKSYQLARNALAATVSKEGKLDPARGHVLVVYDARNPEFLADGKAENQWRFIEKASLVPGLFRRISWQRLMTELAMASELNYLVQGMGNKYGFKTE